MRSAAVGIIGGTGLGQALVARGGETVEMDTPYGRPSSDIILADWRNVPVAFLSRHGPGHTFHPTTVPYRANIWALKKLGVEAILASGATGSLREDVEPRHLVICDQVIDRTSKRASTFFDEGIAVHVAFADPFCGRLRRHLVSVRDAVETVVHDGGTYVCMEGPQFSTRAESLMHRTWGGDLIGMTCMPEARLAREAEMCYALVAIPTDYDCWKPAPPGGHDAIVEHVLANIEAGTASALHLMEAALRQWSKLDGECGCRSALKLGIWSDVSRVDPKILKRHALLLEHYLPGTKD